MKVKDLIMELKKFDPELEVYGNSSEGGEFVLLINNPFYISNVKQQIGTYGSGKTFVYMEEDSKGNPILTIDIP